LPQKINYGVKEQHVAQSNQQENQPTVVPDQMRHLMGQNCFQIIILRLIQKAPGNQDAWPQQAKGAGKTGGPFAE